jgi:hypothetical protein
MKNTLTLTFPSEASKERFLADLGECLRYCGDDREWEDFLETDEAAQPIIAATETETNEQFVRTINAAAQISDHVWARSERVLAYLKPHLTPEK